MKSFGLILPLFLTAVLVGTPAYAKGEASPGLPILYIGKFKPVEELSDGFGPLHALNSDIRHLKSRENASRLSTALIEALGKHGVRAEQVPEPSALQPKSVPPGRGP